MHVLDDFTKLEIIEDTILPLKERNDPLRRTFVELPYR